MRYLKLTMYKRVLLKLSGEALAAGAGFGIDAVFIHKVAAEIAAVHALGCQIGIVVGGGNFFRGVAQQAIDMDRVAADHMGMLSTVINAIAMQDAIEKLGLVLPGDVGDRDAPGSGALYSAAGDAASGEGADCDFCGGDGESVFFDRYGG